MGEMDGMLDLLGPMFGLDGEKIAEMKALTEKKEAEEKRKALMLARLYKWAKKHDPKAMEEVLADAKKAQEGK